MVEYVVSLDKLGNHDVEHVGGKNASLGEMISNLAGAGVSVPGGFATTAQAYRDFLELSGLNEQIHAALDALDVDDVNALARTGAQIRQWVMEAEFPEKLNEEIRTAFATLSAGNPDMAVAVRSPLRVFSPATHMRPERTRYTPNSSRSRSTWCGLRPV